METFNRTVVITPAVREAIRECLAPNGIERVAMFQCLAYSDKLTIVQVHPLVNESPHPKRAFYVSESALQQAITPGSIPILAHSHCNERQAKGPSKADFRGLPSYVAGGCVYVACLERLVFYTRSRRAQIVSL